jgi:ribosomal-protein-alanine N-acetyltransferase
MFDCCDFILAPLVADEASALNKLMLDNVERFQPYFPKTLEANLSVEKSTAFIKQMSEDIENRILFLFALKTETAIAGLIYIKELDWKKKEGEFAYCIGTAYARKGWISEGVARLSEYAFKDNNLESLIIITHKSNKGSVNIAKKNNFQFIKTLRNEFTPSGKAPMDMELYQLKK